MQFSISRRLFMAAAGAVPAFDASRLVAAVPTMSVEGLKVNGLDDPMAVHSPTPRLAWRLTGSRRGLKQRSFRIGVASSLAKARRGDFDLWDSGRVEKALNFDVKYGGRPLASRACCFWTVTVWDDEGNAATSRIAKWEMGLLRSEDWNGKWIAAETGRLREDRLAGFRWMTANAESKTSSEGRAFRLPFELPSDADVTLYFASNQAAEIVIDGKPVDIPTVSPVAWGPPPSIQRQLKLGAGAHVLAVFVPVVNNPNGGMRDPNAAVLISARLADGRLIHFSGDHMVQAAGKPSGWHDVRQAGGTWSPVQPVVSDRAAPFPGQGAFMMRRPFTVQGKVRSAKLYVTALGAYVPFLNGKRLTDASLAPEWTDFRENIFYRSFDVSDALAPGENMLGAIVGDGWYGSYCAPMGRYSFGEPPLRLRAQLELEYEDGRRDVVGTDERWNVAPSHIVASEIYDGETVDARLRRDDWCLAGKGAQMGWEPVHQEKTPPIALIGSPIPPIRPVGTMRPVKIHQLEAGSCVVDFGQNFAGWVRLDVRGDAGRQISIRYAELLKDDGSVDQTNLRGARSTDFYTLRGDGDGERFEPIFTYHGFRYVQIDGLAGALASSAVTGIIVRSDLIETGSLELAQYVPQRLWQNGLWSQRSNFFGTPTDCPQRDERLGWMGDANVFWDAACFNMDSEAFTRKFMLNVREAQRDDGSFPDIAPNPDKLHFVPPGSSPGWSDAGVILPWTSWQRYGDTGVIDENWEAMERYLASVQGSNPDLIWATARGNDYGDWLALDAKKPGDPTTPKDLVATAMWKSAVDAMADMARATGRDDAAAEYQALSNGLVQAFQRAFVKADGTIGNGSQTGYILSLQFDMLSAELRPKAAEHLVADIERRGGLLSTGFLGTPYSLDVLSNAGQSRLVYDLLLRTEFPSWGYMIKAGATTIWERWNSDAGDRTMNSFNHYALGAVSGFMYRRIAGIDPIAPAFSRFRFDPVFDARMPKAAGRYESRAGLISTRWVRRDDGVFKLELNVPGNSRCELHLPAKSLTQVRESGRSAEDFSRLAVRSDRVVLDVGSGEYAFTVDQANY